MKNEKPVSQKEIDEIKKSYEVCIVQYLCDSDPFWNPNTNCSGFYEDDVKESMRLLKAYEKSNKPEKYKKKSGGK